MTLFLEFLKRFWKPILGFLLSISIFLFGFFFAKSHWQAPLLEKIHDYESAQEKYQAEIKVISETAKKNAEQAEVKIDLANSKIDEISSQYEKLKSTKPRIIYTIVDPRDTNKKLPIEFNRNGQMICNRFSDDYLESLNKMINEANK